MSFNNESFPTNCTVDADCDPYNTNRMCFAGAAWLKENQSECLCNNYYGWEGPDCTEYSTGTYLSIIFFSALSLVGFGFLTHCFGVLINRARTSPISPFIPLTAGNTTAMLVACALLFSTAFNITTVFNFAVNEGTPNEFFVTDKDGFGRFEWWGRNVFTPGMGLFIVMAELNLCLMWIDISTHAKNLKPTSLKNLGKSRKILIYTQIAMVVVMTLGLIGFTITGFPLIAYFSAPFPVICAYLYIRGARQMTAVLKTPFTRQDTEIAITHNKFIVMINRVTRRIVFLNTYFVLASIAYAYTNPPDDAVLRDISVPGRWLTLDKFIHHSNFLALNIMCFVLWHYLRPTSKMKSRNEDITNQELTQTESFEFDATPIPYRYVTKNSKYHASSLGGPSGPSVDLDGSYVDL